MSLANVESILGGPARDESTGPLVESHPGMEAVHEMNRLKQSILTMPFVAEPTCWVSDELLVVIYFDTEGRVFWCRSVPCMRADDPFRTLRRWLGL
jgi:hypothetical protein